MTELEREELETYRAKSENGQIAAYYLLAEELGVRAGGSVVDTVTGIVKERDRFSVALTRIRTENLSRFDCILIAAEAQGFLK